VTPAELNRLDALHARIQPTPWVTNGQRVLDENGFGVADFSCGYDVAPENNEEARLCAALVNAWPAIRAELNELARLRIVNERLSRLGEAPEHSDTPRYYRVGEKPEET
jgi:hypothetical protein